MKKLRVSDVMTKRVIFVREDAPFKEIARLMADNCVSGVPVLDADYRLVGIVSEGDLLAAEDPHVPRSPLVRLIEGRWLGVGDDLRARDVMMRNLVTIGPDEPIDAAARAILTNGVKRLPVVDEDDHVLGIVSRTDLLKPYLRDDESIRKEIVEDVILDTMWIDPSTIAATVDSGVVTLDGTVETKSTAEVLEKLVHRVIGVVGVKSRLQHRGEDRPGGPPREMVGFGFGRGKLT